MLKSTGWLLLATLGAVAPPTLAQFAPTGEHYAGRASDTGYGGTFVNSTGTFAASVPLNLPATRGELPIPLQITYGAHGVGAAGLGWDVPLSYIERTSTMAHRRPASSPAVAPVPRDRIYLSLLGQNVELIPEGSDWITRSGTLELRVRQSANTWLVYDGNGRTYTFVRPATLGNLGLWLLDSISAADAASLQLTYQIATVPLDGGSGIAINLVRIAYNSNTAQGVRCPKNEVNLTYGNQSPTPLSISILGDRILARNNTLTLVDVGSRANCGSPLQSLRSYDFQYTPDTDTNQPRLGTVRMFGRDGTPEKNTPLPVATYAYGSATENGKLRYESTQAIDLPAGAANDQISGTALDSSVNAPIPGSGYAMWQSLIDVNGDGRPDLVFKRNDKLWVAYNLPSPDGKTTLGTANGPSLVQLSDATFATGGIAAHTDAQRRFQYAPENRNTTDVWRQEIDVNGDGRIDIIDAAEEAGHWVIYLNTPGGGPTGIQWQRRSFSVAALRDALIGGGHQIAGNFVPLSRRATGTDGKMWRCWQWDGMHWNWWAEGFALHRCEGTAQELTERGPERTFVEWELNDLNGDGYPDFVFNSSPVDFQRTVPATSFPPPVSGAVAMGLSTVQFSPPPTNDVRAMFNVLGVRFYTDDNPFSQPVSLHAADAGQGVAEWICTGAPPGSTVFCDDSSQSQYIALVDVNGDGLADRVTGDRVYLGTYASTAITFSPVYMTLPGNLATQSNTHKEQCSSVTGQKPIAEQTQGLRDLTGDGIPDYFDWSPQRGTELWIGTGTGFRDPIAIQVDGAFFHFSHESESCNGDKSNTDGGLYDIDGDGRPEIIGLVGNTLSVSRLAGGQASGRPEAGRLTQISNGYGATTSISYVSAKSFTENALPFPEIVVTSALTTGTQNPGAMLAGTRYAYGRGEMIFDSALDRFAFSGYERVVQVRLTGVQPPAVGTAGGVDAAGIPTIADTWPLTPFDPAQTKPERWLRMQRVGRARDVYTLRGVPDPDPWPLLNVDASDGRVIGINHYEWDAKLYELPQSPNPNAIDCLEMTVPLDFQLSLASSGPQGIDPCRAHGFAFGASESSWYGAQPPPSDDNVQTRSLTLGVDDFGRTIAIEYDNDVFRADDDICVANTFAAPAGAFPRVLNALASRQFHDCGKDVTFASESWLYDGLAPGSVAAGHVTSHRVDRRATSTGALLNTVRKFDTTYDAAGNVATVQTQRDGATRTVAFSYDPFGLVPTHTSLTATGVSPRDFVAGYDPISLQLVSSTDANHLKRSVDFDGFARPIRTSVTIPGGSPGVVSTAAYSGFDDTDPDGRRITVRSFDNPVPLASVPTAAGHSGTVFLDELGRERRSELALGSDYTNSVLVVSARTYDGAGRVVFAADPYLKDQDPATAYGTTYLFKNTGDVDCVIRGRGPQPLNTVTDLATERFPRCFQRSFTGHVETLDDRDAASLQAGSPQAGVVERVVRTAIGLVIERSAWIGATRIEDATFSFDRLGQQVSMTRFLDPVHAAGPVQWSSQLDSVGQTLRLAEPNAAARNYRYTDWGEQVETQWMDGAVDRRLVSQHDAMGRLSATEERNNGVTDPETVNTYAYDSGVTVTPMVTPTFVLGHLARANSPSGQIAFGYDAFGRVNAQVFADNDGGLFIEKTEQLQDGRLAALEFHLPDLDYSQELVKYGYDSAGRLKAMQYTDPSGTRELYRSQIVDAFGHVQKALVGGNTLFQSTYDDGGRRLLKEAAVGSSLGSRRLIFAPLDPDGRELSRREIRDGASAGPETDVAYDAFGRLRRALKIDGGITTSDWQYTYDALGNVLELKDSVGSAGAALSYRTDDPDRVCRIGYGPGGLGGNACNVNHDALGNIVQQVTRTGLRRLSYFDSGSVRGILEGSTQANFRYDAFGRVQQLDLTGSNVPDERHDRRYGNLIERRDQVVNGTTTTFISRTIPGPGGIVASRRGTKQDWVFQFGEQRGYRFSVDGAGAFLQNTDYQPFGEASSSGAAPGSTDYTHLQWNGDDALAALGLSNLGARLYDPVIGRFLRRDPLLLPRTATTSNPYAFAVNDPINGADPSGLDCIGSEQCQGLTPLNPIGLIGGLFGGFGSGGTGQGSAPAPPVSAGPQTEAGEELQIWSRLRLGYTIANVDYDQIAKSGEGMSSMLDRLSQEPAIELEEYNARISRHQNYFRIGGYALVTVGTLGAAFAEGAGLLLLSRGSLAAAGRFIPLASSGGLAATGLQNAEDELSEETPALAGVINGRRPGQGFSGVYDKSNGRITFKPSTGARYDVPPPGFVVRNGGHITLSDELTGSHADHSGFALILQNDGSLNVTWRSGGLNPAPDFMVPLDLRGAIIGAIEKATGRVVNDQ